MVNSTFNNKTNGNVFALLFAAVAMTGVLGVVGMQTVSGPVRTITKVTQQNIAETDLMTNAKIVVLNGAILGDPDSDNYIEPAAFRTCTTGPVNGGCLPQDIGAVQTDPWGTPYGYCVWDHGATTGAAGMLGGIDDTSEPVIAIISAGPDKIFQTQCTDVTAAGVGGVERAGDDLLKTETYTAALAGAGGLWSLKDSDPDTAIIDKNLEIGDVTAGQGFAFDSVSNQGQLPYLRVDTLVPRSAGAIDIEDAQMQAANESLIADGICASGTAGTLRWNSSGVLQVCNGTSFVDLATAGDEPWRIIDEAHSSDTYITVAGTSNTNTNEITMTTAGVDRVVINDSGAVAIAGSLGVTGTVGVGGDLNVTGNSDLDGTLDVTGNSVLNGTLSVAGTSTMADIDAATLDTTGDVSVGGDLTVAGNDIIMGTNTAGFIMVADGTSFTPVPVSGDITLAFDGSVNIINNAITSDKIDDGTIQPIDLDAAGAIVGHCLKYGASSNFEWDSCSTIENLDDIGDVDVAGVTPGQSLVYDGTNWVPGNAGAAATSAESRKIIDADGDTQIQVEEAADDDIIRFDTAGSERMIIDAAGNVGLGGSSSSSNRLNVFGGIRTNGGDISLSTGRIIGGNTGTPLDLTFNQGNHGYARIRNNCTSTNCSANWQAENSAGRYVKMGIFSTGHSYANGAQIGTDGSALSLQTISDTASIRFQMGSAYTERARFAPSGSLLLGTTTDVASAILNLDSTSRGFLAPRMTTAQRDAIASPATGLVIYNITTNALENYNGTVWGSAGGGGGSTIDALTDAATDYTTDFNIFMGQGAGAAIAAGGQHNLAIGQNAGDALTTGDGNIAIGYEALTAGTISQGAIAIGHRAAARSNNTGTIMAIGRNAGENYNGDFYHSFMALGEETARYVTTGSGITAIGHRALRDWPGQFNTAVGDLAMHGSNGGGGEHNTTVGQFAGGYFAGNRNVLIGSEVFKGAYSGDFDHRGNDSIYIGYASARDATGNNNHRNTFVGASTGLALRNGGDNILIGYNVNVPTGTTSNYLSIGNTIYGDISTDQIGIGASPVASAQLDINSTTRGFLPPRMTTAQRDAIASPATGLVIYNTTTNALENYNGTAWTSFASASGSAANMVDADGDTQIQVEEGADDDTIRFDTAGSERMVIGSDGRVGIGTNSPVSPLQIQGVAGADEVVMRVDASTSSLDLRPAFVVIIPTSGAGKAFHLSRQGDGQGFAAFEYTIGGTAKPGFALGSGTSGRDTNLYRENANTLKTDDTFVANNMAIGANSVNNSAIMDLVSTSRGFLAPRMTTAQKTAIASPATGLMVYDTTLNTLEYYNGTAWTSSGGAGGGSLDDLSDATNNTTTQNIALGHEGTSITSGESNTLVGSNAGFSVTTGTNNTLIGRDAGRNLTSTGDVTVIGVDAGSDIGQQSVVIGKSAGEQATGASNVIIGVFAGQSAGGANVALGLQALYAANSSAEGNVAVGENAGQGTGYNTGNPVNNVFVGRNSGAGIVNGDNNIMIGYQAGDNVSNGNTNIVIGNNIDLPTATTSNYLTIGNTIYGDLTDDRVGIGKVPAAGVELDVLGDIQYTGTITDISDMRLKTDIQKLNTQDMVERLALIDTYSFKMKDDEKGRVEMGVMAQELEKIFPELVHTSNDEMGTKSVNYMGLVAPMIEATKSLKAENEALRAELANVKSEQEMVLAQINTLKTDVQGIKSQTGYGLRDASYANWMMLITLVIFGSVITITAIRRRA